MKSIHQKKDANFLIFLYNEVYIWTFLTSKRLKDKFKCLFTSLVFLFNLTLTKSENLLGKPGLLTSV